MLLKQNWPLPSLPLGRGEIRAASSYLPTPRNESRRELILEAAVVEVAVLPLPPGLHCCCWLLVMYPPWLVLPQCPVRKRNVRGNRTNTHTQARARTRAGTQTHTQETYTTQHTQDTRECRAGSSCRVRGGEEDGMRGRGRGCRRGEGGAARRTQPPTQVNTNLTVYPGPRLRSMSLCSIYHVNWV